MTRLALGETHVIAATKKALASRGVDVALLEASATSGAGEKKRILRSTKVMLVKNLSYEVTHTALQKLFEPFGDLGQVGCI
jgi:multiple RNA-binding domain-containing protein 1